MTNSGSGINSSVNVANQLRFITLQQNSAKTNGSGYLLQTYGTPAQSTPQASQGTMQTAANYQTQPGYQPANQVLNTWRDREAVVGTNCDARLCSIYFQRTPYRLAPFGKLVMEGQAVVLGECKDIRLECDRQISCVAITWLTGRVSLLCNPCGLCNGNGATAGDIQTIEHVIFTGKQVGGVCYFLTACASWQEKIIVDRGLIGNRQRRCRVPLGCFSCVEFCAAKGQNSVAAVLWRFHNHICVLIALDFIAGSIGRHGRSADCHAVGYIAVQSPIKLYQSRPILRQM